MEYDVIVCGAGVSGLPAALFAARSGQRVLLIERESSVGGAPVNCNVNYLSGLIVQGIERELWGIMKKIDPSTSRFFKTPVYLAAWRQLLSGETVDIRTGCRLTGAEKQGDRIVGVRTDRGAFSAAVFVDATGDAVLTRAADLPARYGREAADEFGETRFGRPRADNVVQQATLLYEVRPKYGAEQKGCDAWAKLENGGYLIWGPSGFCADMADERNVAALTQRLVFRAAEDIGAWADKGYEIVAFPKYAGVRETYRAEGAYMLSEGDVFGRRRFDDSICVGDNNIDPWDPEGNVFHTDPDACCSPPYEIPYRCLYSLRCPNLLFTGRCASATHVVQSSLRVMSIAGVLGQAAGLAAALAVQSGVSVAEINRETLRQRMRDGGVCVSLSELTPDFSAEV